MNYIVLDYENSKIRNDVWGCLKTLNKNVRIGQALVLFQSVMEWSTLESQKHFLKSESPIRFIGATNHKDLRIKDDY